MNDRIEKLVKEAGLSYVMVPTNPYVKEDLAKLAELIVKECVAKLEEDYIPEEDIIEGYNEDWDDALHYAVTTIKEHFGVK